MGANYHHHRSDQELKEIEKVVDAVRHEMGMDGVSYCWFFWQHSKDAFVIEFLSGEQAEYKYIEHEKFMELYRTRKWREFIETEEAIAKLKG